MEDAKRRLPSSLPANYVSILDLRERWMKQRQQKKRDEENPPKDPQPHSEIQDELGRGDSEREEKSKGDDHQPDENRIVQLNPNNAVPRLFDGNRRQGEDGNHRWVQVSNGKSLDVLPSKQAPTKSSLPPTPNVRNQRTSKKEELVQSRRNKGVSSTKGDGEENKKEELVQSRRNKGVSSTKGDKEEKADAEIQEKPKALPVLQAYQLKPPLSEADKAEPAVQPPAEIHGSDKEVTDRKHDNRNWKKANVRNRRRNPQKILIQSQPDEGVFTPKSVMEEKANVNVPELQSSRPPLEVLKVDLAVRDPAHTSDEVVNAPNLVTQKKKKPFKKRNHRLKNDVKEKLKPEQEAEAVRETKDASDSSRSKTEGKHAGLSLTSSPAEGCSRGPTAIVAKNRKGWRKDGGYAKFERRAMLKTERARCAGSLVWVKKEESSQIGAVTVENAGNIRE